MKLIELLKVLGNENVIITDSEQVELLLQGTTADAARYFWKDYDRGS